MPSNPADRVQFILGVITFAAVGLGLLLSAFLAVRRRQAHRRAFAVQGGSVLEPLPGSATPERTAPDPYSVAEEALKLFDQSQAENERLRARLAKLEAKHPHGGTLPAAQWLATVNDDANLVPHLGIEGPTRTGKTTLATGILHNREGQILVITAKTGDAWGGLPAVTIDDDGTFKTAAKAFATLRQEVLRRLVAVKHGRDPGPWLTVVLDDYPALRDACEEADEPFLLVARIGASLRVRLLVLTYSVSVKELGLEGKGDARHHFAWITRRRHGTERTATMPWEGQTYDLETGPVIAQATRLFDPARAWRAAKETPASPAAAPNFLTVLLEEPAADIAEPLPPIPFMRPVKPAGTPAETHAEHPGTPPERVPAPETVFPAAESDVTSSEGAFSLEEIGQIAAQITRGERERAEIIKSMPRYSGRKYKAYASVYDRLRDAIEDVTQAAA